MTIRQILLVDDDPLVLRMLQRTLQRATTWQILQAHSGIEALIVAARERPDVILLDSMMPDLDGLGTLARLQSNPATASIPVIILTGSLSDRQIDAFLRRGARAVLGKPTISDLLPQQIEQLLGG